MTNNQCFLKAHKQALQRDFARDLLLCGKQPIPGCTMSFLMLLKSSGGYLCHSRMLGPSCTTSPPESFGLFSCLCCSVRCCIPPSPLMLECAVPHIKLVKDVAQPLVLFIAAEIIRTYYF